MIFDENEIFNPFRKFITPLIILLKVDVGHPSKFSN